MQPDTHCRLHCTPICTTEKLTKGSLGTGGSARNPPPSEEPTRPDPSLRWGADPLPGGGWGGGRTPYPPPRVTNLKNSLKLVRRGFWRPARAGPRFDEQRLLVRGGVGGADAAEAPEAAGQQRAEDVRASRSPLGGGGRRRPFSGISTIGSTIFKHPFLMTNKDKW